MVKPFILKAENFDEMESIAKLFTGHGYKIMSSDVKHIIVKKRNFGNWYFHVLFLVLILFIIGYNSLLLYLVCILYISYFIFYLFKRSKIVLITTESRDENGNPVEFYDINNISEIIDH